MCVPALCYSTTIAAGLGLRLSQGKAEQLHRSTPHLVQSRRLTSRHVGALEARHGQGGKPVLRWRCGLLLLQLTCR